MYLDASDIARLKATSKRMLYLVSDLRLEAARLKRLAEYLRSGPEPFVGMAGFGHYGNVVAFRYLSKMMFWYSFGELQKDRPHFAQAIAVLVGMHLNPIVLKALAKLSAPREGFEDFHVCFVASVDELQEELLKEFRVQPYVVYLVLCVVDWYLPRFHELTDVKLAFYPYRVVSLGCIDRHAHLRSTLPPQGVIQRGYKSVQNWPFSYPEVLPEEVLSFVLGPLLLELHPVHHFALAIDLIGKVEDYFEERYVFPRIWGIGVFICHRLGGLFRLDYDGGKLHCVSKKCQELWMSDDERCEQERKKVQLWTDQYYDISETEATVKRTLEAISDIVECAYKFE